MNTPLFNNNILKNKVGVDFVLNSDDYNVDFQNWLPNNSTTLMVAPSLHRPSEPNPTANLHYNLHPQLTVHHPSSTTTSIYNDHET